MKIGLPIFILILMISFGYSSLSKPKQACAVCYNTSWTHRGCQANPCTAQSYYDTWCDCNDNQSCCWNCECQVSCGVCGYNGPECCSPSDGNWSGCQASELLNYCGSANSCGSQNCSPAGGSSQCCLVTAGSCSISSNYTANAAITGCGNGTLTISGGTTTIGSGYTMDAAIYIVSTGYLTTSGTGIVKTSTACD